MEEIKFNKEKDRSIAFEDAKKLFDYLQSQSKSLKSVTENPLLLKHGDEFENARKNLGQLINKYEFTDEEFGATEEDFTKFSIIDTLIKLARIIHKE